MTQLLQSIINRVHPGALVGFATIAVLVGVHELPIQWMTTGIALLVPGVTAVAAKE